MNASGPISVRRSRRSAVLTLAVTVGLVASVVGAAALPAGAGGAWTVAAAPNPTGSITTSLSSVSCPSATSCFAVGSYSTLSATKTLGERWNGHTWSIVSTPNPAGSTAAQYSGVSCPATNSCFAVGSFTIGGLTKNLAAHWNGSSWSGLPIGNPSVTSGSGLSGVQCPTTKSCFAVGAYSIGFTTVRTLAAHWNGALWGLVGSPNISTSNATFLTNVFCPSPKSCFAVGNTTIGTVTKSLVEHWNGSLWGAMASANPSGATVSSLNAVACPTTKSCFAVGNARVASLNRNLAEHWNGASWTIEATPNVSGSSSTGLNGVSCPTSKSCFAAGNATKVGVAKTLVQHWNGSAWGITSTPNAGTFFNHLFGISCAAVTSCAAVGSSETNPPAKALALRYG